MTMIIPREQPELMAHLKLVSLSQALHLEIVHKMQLRRGVYGLKIAQSMGFKGNRKPAALHWVIAQIRESGHEPIPSIAKWEAENPA